MRPRHIALAVLVAALWGVNFVVIELGLDHFPPLLFSALRFLAAAVPAIFLLGRPSVAWKWVVGVGLVLGVGKFGLLFIGMDQGMPAGLSSLVLQIQAVFTALFAALALSERPGRIRVAGMAVALAGIAVAAVDEGAGGPVLAFVLVVGAAACWGVSNVFTRRAAPKDALTFMVWVSAVPVLPLLGLSLLFEGPDRDAEALASLDWSRGGHHPVRRLGQHGVRLRRLGLPAPPVPRLVRGALHPARPGVRDVLGGARARRGGEPAALVRGGAAGGRGGADLGRRTPDRYCFGAPSRSRCSRPAASRPGSSAAPGCQRFSYSQHTHVSGPSSSRHSASGSTPEPSGSGVRSSAEATSFTCT